MICNRARERPTGERASKWWWIAGDRVQIDHTSVVVARVAHAICAVCAVPSGLVSIGYRRRRSFPSACPALTHGCSSMLLFILRHGQAHERPPSPHGSDRDRELTDLGRRQARFIGDLLGQLILVRELHTLASSATRAQQTAACVAEEFTSTPHRLAPPVDTLDELMVDRPVRLAVEKVEEALRAAAGELCQTSAASRTHPNARALLIVGHNPQLTELVFSLRQHASISRTNWPVLPNDPERFEGLRTGEMAAFDVTSVTSDDWRTWRWSTFGTIRLLDEN